MLDESALSAVKPGQYLHEIPLGNNRCNIGCEGDTAGESLEARVVARNFYSEGRVPIPVTFKYSREKHGSTSFTRCYWLVIKICIT